MPVQEEVLEELVAWEEVQQEPDYVSSDYCNFCNGKIQTFNDLRFPEFTPKPPPKPRSR